MRRMKQKKKINRRQSVNKHTALYLLTNLSSEEYETGIVPRAPTSNAL